MVEGLLPDTHRPGSTRVVINGRLAWTVPDDVIAALGIVVGQPIRGETGERLNRAADEEAAFRAALRALERRAHAERELKIKLERKGHSTLAADDALNRLRALGLVDDREFARNYATVRGDRGRGPARLRHDLLRLGVDRPVVEAVLADIAATIDDPLAGARSILARRARQLDGVPRDTRRRRLLAFLGRRGYRGSDALGLVAEVLKPSA